MLLNIRLQKRSMAQILIGLMLHLARLIMQRTNVRMQQLPVQVRHQMPGSGMLQNSNLKMHGRHPQTLHNSIPDSGRSSVDQSCILQTTLSSDACPQELAPLAEAPSAAETQLDFEYPNLERFYKVEAYLHHVPLPGLVMRVEW